jgi:DNA-binding NarL/FixJ family response regulator
MSDSPSMPDAVVVLGRPGLQRDVVQYLVAHAQPVIELTRLESEEGGTVVAVLVDPAAEDWERAREMSSAVIVILDQEPGDERLLLLLSRGADAVLTTNVSLEEVVEAIEVVAQGDSLLSTRQANVVLAAFRQDSARLSPSLRLTKREADILASIGRGDAVKQTARTLGISEKTVQNLQSRLFRKIGARNRAQAVTRAHDLGLLPDLETS